MELPAQTTLKRVDTVRYGSDGTSLKTVVFLTKDQLDRQNSDWEAETGNNPQSWTYENQAARIIPIATDDVLTSLKIRAIIAPDVTTIGSNVIPDLLFHEHEEWLKAGVWAQLMAQAGKDWSQPAQAVKYERMFEFGIKQAKSRSEADFGQPDRESAYGGIPV